MNKKLYNKLQDKELHKKVLGAYMWLVENKNGFKIKLNKVQLKEAHSKGEKIRKANQDQNTRERLDQLLKSGDFLKANGKVNISLLAKAMNMTRKTVAKYV